MDDELKTKYKSLFFGVRRSVRYHARRRMFFERCHMATSAVNVIFGSAALMAILASAPRVTGVAAASLLATAGFERRTWGTIQKSYKAVRRRVREDSASAAARYYVPGWFPGETPQRAAYFHEEGRPTDGWGMLLDGLY